MAPASRRGGRPRLGLRRPHAAVGAGAAVELQGLHEQRLEPGTARRAVGPMACTLLVEHGELPATLPDRLADPVRQGSVRERRRPMLGPSAPCRCIPLAAPWPHVPRRHRPDPAVGLRDPVRRLPHPAPGAWPHDAVVTPRRAPRRRGGAGRRRGREGPERRRARPPRDAAASSRRARRGAARPAAPRRLLHPVLRARLLPAAGAGAAPQPAAVAGGRRARPAARAAVGGGRPGGAGAARRHRRKRLPAGRAGGRVDGEGAVEPRQGGAQAAPLEGAGGEGQPRHPGGREAHRRRRRHAEPSAAGAGQTTRA